MPVQIKITGIYPEKDVMSRHGAKVLAALENTLKTRVALRLETAMKKRMRGWSSGPTIKSTYRSLPHRFVLEVMPFGRGKSKWIWVTQGVKPHIIFSSRKWMQIKKGYSPHTRPGNFYGGSGSYSGPFYTVPPFYAVGHPGFPARKFEEHIVREEEGRVRQMLLDAIRFVT